MSIGDTETTTADQPRRRGIELFRGAQAPSLFESGIMSTPLLDAEDQKVIAAEGSRNPDVVLGTHDAVPFRGEGENGFSLVRAWFGAHFVLPRHTHNADCLYYIIEGSLTMGSVALGVGDGFFVPSGAPYGYEAGPDGVVVLEFRAGTSFDMTVLGGQVDRLRRMAGSAEANVEVWKATRPGQ